MLIMQHEAVPPISAANPLPSAFWRAEFRCQAARRNAVQTVDILGLFAIEAAIFRRQSRVSPCCQGISAGFALAREARSPTGGATRAATPRAAAAAAYRARGRTGYGRRR